MPNPLSPDPLFGPIWAQRVVYFMFLGMSLMGKHPNENAYIRCVKAIAKIS